MANKRLDTNWDIASCVLCMIHNANCGKGKAKSPIDFNPRVKRSRKGTPISAANIEALKCFVSREHGGTA